MPVHPGARSAPPWSSTREASITTLVRLRITLRTGQLLAPSQGLGCSASTAGSHPTPGAVLPGTLASPRTGLTPAGCRELVARLRHHNLLGRHGARAPGRTVDPEPALVVGRRLLLVLRVDLVQRRVEDRKSVV